MACRMASLADSSDRSNCPHTSLYSSAVARDSPTCAAIAPRYGPAEMLDAS